MLCCYSNAFRGSIILMACSICFHLCNCFSSISFSATANTEVSSNQFMRNFHNFTGSKFDLRIEWITRNTKSLFEIKDKRLHPAFKIYRDICSYGETYIAETVRNVETRWNEHNMPSKKSKHSKHLNTNRQHHFSRSAI